MSTDYRFAGSMVEGARLTGSMRKFEPGGEMSPRRQDVARAQALYRSLPDGIEFNARRRVVRFHSMTSAIAFWQQMPHWICQSLNR
jgi:hypothetical protein